MDFEEKMTKQGTTQECNEVYWEAEFQRNKKTYSKLDNVPMCLRQLYVIPTLEPFFNAKKIKKKKKNKNSKYARKDMILKKTKNKKGTLLFTQCKKSDAQIILIA